ncbi:MAG: PAS domain S-box protein [Ferruginibacter sp.]|nr:PAS domain S-box protein [Ferruginibacter sp.]
MTSNQSYHVLILCSDEHLWKLLREVWMQTPYKEITLHHVQTIDEAVQIYQPGAFQLIFLGFSDAEAYDTAVRKYIRHIPVIGLGFPETKISSSNPEAPAYLSLQDLNPVMLTTCVGFSFQKFELAKGIERADERYKMMAGYSSEIIWDWNLKTNVLMLNVDGWTKLMGEGLEEEVMTFEEWMSFVHPEDDAFVRDYFNKIIKNPLAHTFDVDYRMRSKNGYIYINEKGSAFRAEDGVAYRLIGASKDITQKKISEEELRKLSLIVRETSSAVVITDTNGIAIWVNEAYTRITGYRYDELIGNVPGKILQGPETDSQVVEYMSKQIKNRQSFECEVLNYTKEGKKIWLRIQCQPQFNERGEHEGFFAIQTDITPQKEIEQQVTHNEKRLRALLEKNNDGLALLSPNGKLISLLSGHQILEYTEEELGSLHYSYYVHPDDQELLSETFSTVVYNPGESTHLELRVQKKSGSFIWVEITFRNQMNNSYVGAIIANFRDINERKIAEGLIKSSEEKYRKLFNYNPLSLFVWNPDNFEILEVNESAISEYGYNREEFIGMSVVDLVAPEYKNRFMQTAQKIKSNHQFITSYTSTNLKKNGEVIHIFITYQPIEYFGKRVNLAMVNNITEQVLLENQLTAEQNLKQKEITRAVITAQEQERQHISRELHDNINQILATTRLYVEYAMTNEAMRMQLLGNAKDLILTAVNEIRNLSRALLPSAIETAGLIASLDDLFDSIKKINKYEIETIWHFEEVTLSDTLKLTLFRIVQEQLNNIIKHAEATRISTVIKDTGQQLILSVKDDGVGLKDDTAGVGLGLKNIRSRAALHNGEMEIISRKGQGTELIVRFKW